MRYVLDSCVAVKWALFEEHSRPAIRLRRSVQNEVTELIAPDVFPVEVGHALMRAERQKRITPAQGEDLWTDVMLDMPQLFPSIDLRRRALALSAESRIGVYDGLYIALAERENCPLITADEKLLRAVKTDAAMLHIKDIPGTEEPS